MNDSINCTGFVEMFVDSYDDYEPYGHSFSDAATERVKNLIQLYAADLDDSEYTYSE